MYRLLPLLFLLACTQPPATESRTPGSPIALIVDADTANEVDDLFALVRAVNEPAFDLRGITSAQFHTSPLATDSTVVESQRINEALMDLLNRGDLPLPLGANGPLTSAAAPRPSPASAFIIREAMQLPADRQLHVVILGSCTNVASAILEEPAIVPRLSVHYLGFWHDPASNTYDKKEFNSGNDTVAVNLLLDTEGLEMEVMSATTSQHLVFDRDTVAARLEGTSALGDYLLNRWDTYDRWWTKADPEKQRWIMWDVAIIEALARPDLARKLNFTTPPENGLREIDIYTDLDTVGMHRDYWRHLTETFK